ncbi:hypothetical protein QBC44DRAFT_318967, partial [Cladorrhinum sp. PSN332]
MHRRLPRSVDCRETTAVIGGILFSLCLSLLPSLSFGSAQLWQPIAGGERWNKFCVSFSNRHTKAYECWSQCQVVVLGLVERTNSTLCQTRLQCCVSFHKHMSIVPQADTWSKTSPVSFFDEKLRIPLGKREQSSAV